MKNFVRISGLLAGISTALLVASPAFADGASFGDEGQFVLGAERLMGNYAYKGTMETNYDGHKYEQSVSGGEFTLGSGVSLADSDTVAVNPNATPRLGIDFFVAPQLSIGGSLGYFKTTSEREDDGGHKQDGPELSGFFLAPRVGYQIGFNEMWGLWLRGGFTYVSYKDEAPSGSKVEATIGQVTVEGMFNVSLADGFGLMFGPVIDVGVTGDIEATDSEGNKSPYDIDLKWTNAGAVLGLYGYM